MATVTLRNLYKSYGDVEVIKGVDLDIQDREFVVFVGPSGCGKSTLLRMIAGLEEITSGDLSIDGERVNDVPPAERGLAMVFQSYALYPHMSVADNMAFSLRLAGVGKARALPEGPRGGPRPAARAAARAQAARALRRPAPARRDRPRDRAQPQGLPVRRAALQPRRRAARADADRARPAARGAQGDHDLRHPRSGRGDDAGRPDRGAGRRRWCSRPARRSSSTTTRRTCSSPASSARPR